MALKRAGFTNDQIEMIIGRQPGKPGYGQPQHSWSSWNNQSGRNQGITRYEQPQHDQFYYETACTWNHRVDNVIAGCNNTGKHFE